MGQLAPYRQAASLLNEFLPLSPEGVSHVEVRRQTMKVGERLDSRATEGDEYALHVQSPDAPPPPASHLWSPWMELTSGLMA